MTHMKAERSNNKCKPDICYKSFKERQMRNKAKRFITPAFLKNDTIINPTALVVSLLYSLLYCWSLGGTPPLMLAHPILQEITERYLTSGRNANHSGCFPASLFNRSPYHKQNQPESPRYESKGKSKCKYTANRFSSKQLHACELHQIFTPDSLQLISVQL